MRLFAAIPIGNKAADEFVELQEKMRQSEARLKFVERENLHMTLRFIGEGDVGEWVERIERISEKPFKVLFDRMGVFPARGRPRVIWAGCEPVESLLNIHRLIGGGELVPHVTLARVHGKADGRLLDMLDNGFAIAADVEKVLLMNSSLTTQGPVYGVIYEKAL